jgi:hypothetical protein
MIYKPIFRLRVQLSILNDIKREYGELTINEAIQQIGNRIEQLQEQEQDEIINENYRKIE